MCDRSLSELLSSSHAAEHCSSVNDSIVFCNNIFETLFNKFTKYYFDLNNTKSYFMRKSNFDSLIFFHFKIRSLSKKFDKMYDFLELLTL